VKPLDVCIPEALESRPTVWVTTSWDDGYPLDLRLAELLDRYGVSGTFYVPVRSQLPVMGAAEIREVARRFEIGGHTLNHVRLDQVTPRAGREEIFESKQRLEDITGVPCTMFCPPSGRYRRAHLRDMRDAGYLGLRTVELMSVAYPVSSDGLMRLPVTVQVYPHHLSTYLKNALKRGAWKNLRTYFAHARGLELAQASGALLESLLENGGVLHLWGHSWELEHSRLWGTLEDILKQVRVYRDRCRFVTNHELCAHFRSAASPIHEGIRVLQQ
jgi:peptidoglycan/xylan/chitin deacetylase (PgdA/CDA1 family)